MGGTYVATHPSPAHEDAYRVCRRCPVFTHANPRASGGVATSGTGRRIDSARRASGDATASSPISWSPFPYLYGRVASLVKQKQLRAHLSLRAQLEQLLAILRQREKVTRREKPWVRTHVVIPKPGVPGRGYYRSELPRPGVPGRGHCRPKCPTRLPTGWHRRLLNLLSNTPQTTWCCSGSPVLLFAVVPFIVCRRRRVIFLGEAGDDGRKGQAF